MHKTRVAVLRGGPSEEYNVSLTTGASMLKAIDRNRYEPIDVVITRGGEWLLRGAVRDPKDILSHVDVALLALHGAYGEDGQVQRLLESAGVRYTGSGPYGSAIALNKPITKDHLVPHGIKMAGGMVVGRESLSNLQGVVRAVSELFGPQYIVKPIASGSSIGAGFADSPMTLEGVLSKTLNAYEQVLVEEFIDGKEATCGVVENFRGKNLYALPPIEIRRTTPVWGYGAKYDGSVAELCPGEFSRSEKEEIERLALLAHEALGLSHYSRSDFIVSPKGIYFLEVNTLPGMTPTSLVPKALDAVGCTYEQFIDHLLELAQTR